MRGKKDALLQVRILEHRQNDMTLRGIRVKALVRLLIIVLEEDGRVLPLGYIEVVLSAVQAQHIGF